MPPSSCHSLRAPRGFQNKTHTSYPIWWSPVSPSPSTCHPDPSSCPRAFAHLVFCLEHRPPCWLVGASSAIQVAAECLSSQGTSKSPIYALPPPTFPTQKWHNLIFCGLHLSLREPMKTENLQVLTLLHQLLALRSCQINIRGSGGGERHRVGGAGKKDDFQSHLSTPRHMCANSIRNSIFPSKLFFW